MLEFAIVLIAVVFGFVVAGKFVARRRREQEQGLSPDEIRRKRALERMVDNTNL